MKRLLYISVLVCAYLSIVAHSFVPHHHLIEGSLCVFDSEHLDLHCCDCSSGDDHSADHSHSSDHSDDENCFLDNIVSRLGGDDHYDWAYVSQLILFASCWGEIFFDEGVTVGYASFTPPPYFAPSLLCYGLRAPPVAFLG